MHFKEISIKKALFWLRNLCSYISDQLDQSSNSIFLQVQLHVYIFWNISLEYH